MLPLHLLFLAASLTVGLLLLWLDGRRRYDGQIALYYLVLHDGAKGLLESLREPYVMQLQLVSLAGAALGLLGLWYMARRLRRMAARPAAGS